VKWIFGILCLCFAALGFGVRLHPENVFQGENLENYYEIEFFSGQKLIGQAVRESADVFEMSLGSGSAVFKKNEIKSRRGLTPDAVKEGGYSGDILRKTRQGSPLISVRYEDSFFYTAESRLEAMLSRVFGKENTAIRSAHSLNLEHAAELRPETVLPGGGLGLTSAVPSSAMRGFSAAQDKEQDYTAVLKAGLEQLRRSSAQ